jgi:flagellar biosynthetic protein FliR
MNAADLAALPTLAFGFMLVIARAGSALLAGPGFGENDVPPPIRVALAVVLAGLVFPVLQTRLPGIPTDFIGLGALLGVEILVGLWMGLLARLMVGALSMAGGILSLTIGLSNVLQIDPTVGGQTSSLQRLMSLAALAMFFASNLYLYPLQAIIGSYDVIAPGAALDAGGAADLVIRVVGASFGLALRLAAPFIVTSIVWQAGLGFLSRLVPHIQVHLVSAPAQILGGLALLAVAFTTLFAAFSNTVTSQMSTLPGM